MKTLTTLFAMVMIVTMLAIAALVQLVLSVAPFLVVALIVAMVLRARRIAATPPVAGWTQDRHPLRVAAPPQHRVGAPTAAPGGWVMVPVWVVPTPRPAVIDAEVIGDRD